jgi:hypothetical protein
MSKNHYIIYFYFCVIFILYKLYIYKMNPEGEQVNYSKCEFIPTEVNHDLHGVVGKKLNFDYQRDGLMTTNLDNTRLTGCSDPGIMFDTRRQMSKKNVNVYDDYETTEMIIGLSPDGFKELDEPQDNNHIITMTISPLIKPETNVNNISIRNTGGAICKKLTKQYYSNFYRLFDDIIVDNTGEGNIYLVIDTGDDLVKKLGQSLQGQEEFNYNIHVIHSLLTLADSAKKTRPDSKNYTNPYRHLTQYSWLYNVPSIIEPNNEIFMSNYQITNNFNQGSFDWKIRQTWNLPQNRGRNPDYQTNNAHVDNNKTVVIKEITEGQQNTNANISNINLAFQKKRSGDHLQILAAKGLPELLHNNSETSFTQVRTNNTTQHRLVGKDLDYYRRNLFFVTGDWPAFSYAIYNRINSIIMIRTPKMETSFTLVVMFNQNV